MCRRRKRHLTRFGQGAKFGQPLQHRTGKVKLPQSLAQADIRHPDGAAIHVYLRADRRQGGVAQVMQGGLQGKTAGQGARG